MSYARFSSDDWRSDVYVYSDGKHIIVNVATSRYPDNGPHEAIGLAEMARQLTPIGGPFDGAAHEFYTGDDAILFLHQLQGHGYHVPDDCLDALVGELP